MNCYLIALSLVCFLSGLISTSDAYYDREKFKQICINDNANDDAIFLNAQGLIKRAGFDYKEYWSIAPDGFVTQMVLIINQKANQTLLRKPPVMLFHGANIDMASWVVTSNIQHHPEKYPRTAADGPITSYNTSLAFTLANNGFQVILVGQRGSNRLNRYYTTDVATARQQARNGTFKPTPQMYQYSLTSEYWNKYELDDIIKYEIGNQIDDVKYYFNTTQVIIYSYSLSTPTTMAFLAANPDYAKNVTVYGQQAPAIAADHIYAIDNIYFEKICPYLPTRGIGFTPSFVLKPIVRAAIIQLSKSADLRYSLIYRFVVALFGPSEKYYTNLDRCLLAHVFESVSFKSVGHYCQNSLSKQTLYFDYGLNNTQHYNQTTPPAHNVSSVLVQRYLVVSGDNDGLADTTTVQRLIETTYTINPIIHIIAPGFNHVDFLGNIQVDKYVVLKVLAEFIKYSY